jgi:hypothetical protein
MNSMIQALLWILLHRSSGFHVPAQFRLFLPLTEATSPHRESENQADAFRLRGVSRLFAAEMTMR